MLWNPALSALRDVLAELYPDAASQRPVLADAGLDATRVSLGQAPVRDWQAILEEAAKQEGDIEKIIEVAVGQYGGNKGLLAARDAYRAERRPAWRGSPFRGLQPMTPEDAPIFFGRERDAGDLLARVRASRFVVVVGASGSGKSSLVGAGLIPRLQDTPGCADWLWRRFTPRQFGDNPVVAVAHAMQGEWGDPMAEAARLAAQPEHLADLCRSALRGRPAGAELLLFLDQLEELFTLVHPQHVAPFVRLLAQAAGTEGLRMVATLRADFYHRCLEYEPLALLLREGTFPLAAPGPVALGEMIIKPAALAGLSYEGDLAERILRDTGGEPGSLALMAYTLEELYNACCHGEGAPSGGLLSLSAYEALGGVQGAIATRAEAAYNGPALGEAARQALPAVFRELVEVDERGTATRQRAPLRRVAPTPEAAALVEALTQARLLVQSEGEDRQPVVEVAHEAIFRSWPRLRDWIEERQDDLRLRRQVRLAAEDWERSGRSAAYLWPDERLRPVYAMRDRLPWAPDPLAAAFIRPEAERLLEELEDIETTHQRRSAIGERLAAIGDPRPGVGLRPDGLPDIAWCFVPGGELQIGDRTYTVQPFYVARYPVTYVQFQAFVEAPDGFRNPLWWKEFGNRGGESYQQLFKFANHPQDSVTWYAALALCRWLTARLPAEAWPLSLPEQADALGRGKHEPMRLAKREIRLPTEWEWQQAATGGHETNEYPWGPEWEEPYGNTRESGLGRTTAVAMYPQGASPVGALDMSGNVWEWCLNEYRAPMGVAAPRGRSRVVRGGSWHDHHSFARCASRYGFAPGARRGYVGLRLVVAVCLGL